MRVITAAALCGVTVAALGGGLALAGACRTGGGASGSLPRPNAIHNAGTTTAADADGRTAVDVDRRAMTDAGQRTAIAAGGGAGSGAPVPVLVRYAVAGRHAAESLVVAEDGRYTLESANDGLPSSSGTLAPAEISELRQAVASTEGVTPPSPPAVLPPEPPPLFTVTTGGGTGSFLQGAEVRGPWGRLAESLAQIVTAHRAEPPLVATIARDATHVTITNRSAEPVSACVALATAVVTGRGSALVRAWESPSIEPGASARALPHGPRVAACTPVQRVPGWTRTIPLEVGAPRRGETLYVTAYAIVAGEQAAISAER